jgi:hypothetical protein
MMMRSIASTTGRIRACASAPRAVMSEGVAIEPIVA